MPKIPVQDTQAGRSSRTIDDFQGCHYGYGRTDQPRQFAYVVDFDFQQRKAELRDGKRKNQLRGYSADIDGMIFIQIGGRNLVGVIQDGTLSVYPISDMLAQTRRYYTVQEVGDTFTVTSLLGKTLADLIEGNR